MVSFPKKEKRIVIESENKVDLNKGDEEKFKSHRYFSNKVKGFWESFRKAFDI